MKKAKGILLLIFLGAICTSLLSPQRITAEVCDRIVAVVEDDLVTLYELNKRIRQLTGMDPNELERQDKEKYIKTRQRVLDYLIDEKITNKKIKELGIEVTDKEVDQAIEKIKKDNHLTQEGLIAALKAQGMTYVEYRKKVKTDLERMQLINFEVKSKIIIKEKDVKKYYEQHPDQFKVKGSLRLAMIFIPLDGNGDYEARKQLDSTVKTIYERLKSGEQFGDLAQQYSKGPGASEGGDIGEFNPASLDPNIRNAIDNLKEGQISKPIYRPNGVQIIKLVRRYKGPVRPYEEVKEAIYDILYRKEVNKRYYAWIKDLRSKAYIRVCF
ncbi:MAG: peptidylprolyl isomerase [Deltaproteobacteria bacterium]|nr:peptidylprolyl isomerase [Deltaproteobacteria bacterium]MBW2082373.1 peptidylprolyl isomerase [Deltaproteobacteria bacterium]